MAPEKSKEFASVFPLYLFIHAFKNERQLKIQSLTLDAHDANTAAVVRSQETHL